MNAYIYVNSLLHHEASMDNSTRSKKVQMQIVRGSYPLPLMSKGEKEHNHAYKGIIGLGGSMSVSINAKGGDFWKIDCY
jgi:hypothetical protein